jgi:hypothetical protein
MFNCNQSWLIKSGHKVWHASHVNFNVYILTIGCLSIRQKSARSIPIIGQLLHYKQLFRGDIKTIIKRFEAEILPDS